MLIGFLHLTGLSAFASAHVIQFVAYALLAYFSSIFFVKLFPDDFFFVLLGVFLLQTGSLVIPSFDMVGTDYLFSLFPVISALLINECRRSAVWGESQIWPSDMRRHNAQCLAVFSCNLDYYFDSKCSR